MREVHHAGTEDGDEDGARTALARDEERALLEDTANYPRGGPQTHGEGETTYKNEMWGFIGYMLPIFGNQLLWRYFSILGPVTQMGKNGALPLAGAALANTTIALFIIVPCYAASSALDTLSTQAHGGSKYSAIKDLNRLYSLRVYLVLWIMMAFLLPITCLFEPIFILMQVEAKVAHIAARFMQHTAFGVPGFYTYECIRKYCQAQGRMVGLAVALGLAAIPTLPLLLSGYTPAIALGFFWNATAFFAGLYLYFFLPKSTFEEVPTFKLVSQDLGIVIRLTLAGFVSIGSDFVAWRFLNVASAWISNDVLAANSVLLATANFFFSLPAALMNASATRVGNYLGNNQALNAKKAAYTSLLMALALAACSATLVAVNAKPWSEIFTSDLIVIEILQGIMPFFCLIAFIHAIEGISEGILRGAGMPVEIARTLAVCHYTVGTPFSVLLAFGLHRGLFGLWQGFGVGMSLVCIRLVYMIINNDWQASARKAQAHIQASNGTRASIEMTHAV